MAVVVRQRKSGVTYYVTFSFNGKAVWERIGSERREAERHDARRRRELDAGTYLPIATKSSTVDDYARMWGKERTNASAKDDRRNLARFTADREFAALHVDDVRPRHIIELLDRMKRSGKLTLKTLKNAYGTLRTMFRDAHIREHVAASPCVLPNKYFSDHETVERQPYTAAELVALTTHAGIPWPIRVLNALTGLGGLREGEACGRRWKDLDDAPDPLPSLDVRSQYGDRPLKTRRPRVVPVHTELARILTAWAERGFEDLTCRKPTPDDFIVPRLDRRGRLTHHTKSTYYKAFVRACAAASVPQRSLHSTRHTFITLCRRGGADVDVLTVVTHNPKGKVIDQYTHRAWSELCQAVLCLRLDARLDPRRIGDSPRDLPPDSGSTGAPQLKEAIPQADTAPSSIPGASTLDPAKTSQTAKPRQELRQDNPSASVSFRALDDFEIALAEGAERGAVAGVLWPAFPKPLPTFRPRYSRAVRQAVAPAGGGL